jgi:hypothetical protein
MSAGAVSKVSPAGKFTILHTMNGTTDGAYPYAGLIQATDGSFYGANVEGGSSTNCGGSGCGTFFKITPRGTFSILYNFDNTTGQLPYITPFQHTSGIVYGDAQNGGSVGGGVFYRWKDLTMPAFVSLLPYSGKVGKTIEFLGQGFKGTKGVSFNGSAAAFKIVSDVYLTATVPDGATTGSVTVVTKTNGTLMSNKTFRVTPQILSFDPTSGKVGTQVTIKGVSLTQTTRVTFAGVAATSFTVNSDKQVTATVPTGAQTGHIAITTVGGVAVSSGVFTVTQ